MVIAQGKEYSAEELYPYLTKSYLPDPYGQIMVKSQALYLALWLCSPVEKPNDKAKYSHFTCNINCVLRDALVENGHGSLRMDGLPV